MNGHRLIMDRAELECVRDWAVEKIAHGSEPRWAWYQYMKLREALDVILGALGSFYAGRFYAANGEFTTSGAAFEKASPTRLVDLTDSPDTAQHHL